MFLAGVHFNELFLNRKLIRRNSVFKWIHKFIYSNWLKFINYTRTSNVYTKTNTFPCYPFHSIYSIADIFFYPERPFPVWCQLAFWGIISSFPSYSPTPTQKLIDLTCVLYLLVARRLEVSSCSWALSRNFPRDLD